MAKPAKVLIIGSGPIVIGQAAEFDYAGARDGFIWLFYRRFL